MARVQTTWYAGTADTQFQWATTDNDIFDREWDLYRLAQALENHTHEVGKGLPVGRLADLAVSTVMLKDLSVTTIKIADLAVTTAKLADGNVTDAKMANQKANRVGDTFTGDIRLQRGAGVDQGAVFFGTGLNYIFWDGAAITLNNAGGNFVRIVGNGQIYAPSNTNTGYLYLSALGHAIGFDGTNMVAIWTGNTGVICTKANTVEFPLGGACMFSTQAQLTAAGARFARYTPADGRMIAGAGLAGVGGVTLTENTWYGTSWAPGSVLGVSNTLAVSPPTITNAVDAGHSFLAAPGGGGGSTNVSTADHINPNTVGGGVLSGSVALTGGGTNYMPPTFAGVWGFRLS